VWMALAGGLAKKNGLGTRIKQDGEKREVMGRKSQRIREPVLWVQVAAYNPA
jgi:hypothetical protein